MYLGMATKPSLFYLILLLFPRTLGLDLAEKMLCRGCLALGEMLEGTDDFVEIVMVWDSLDGEGIANQVEHAWFLGSEC